MGIWRDIADWIGPTVNRNAGGMSNVVGVVLHIQDGNEQGTIAWQQNAAAQVSSHFLCPKNSPRPAQMVDTADKAWAEAAGNTHWISIENEGFTGDALTDYQLEACAQILAKCHQTYNVPLVSTDTPNGSGLGWHGMGGDSWGGHFDCPGDPVKAQRPQIIHRAQQIIAGNFMTDLDYGTWKRPNDGNRPAIVKVDDVWSAEMGLGSLYTTPPGAKTARQQQLDRVEAKLDQAIAAAKALADLVTNLTVKSQPVKAGDQISMTVNSVTQQ